MKPCSTPSRFSASGSVWQSTIAGIDHLRCQRPNMGAADISGRRITETPVSHSGGRIFIATSAPTSGSHRWNGDENLLQRILVGRASVAAGFGRAGRGHRAGSHATDRICWGATTAVRPPFADSRHGLQAPRRSSQRTATCGPPTPPRSCNRRAASQVRATP